jgi:hypothetical protein
MLINSNKLPTTLSFFFFYIPLYVGKLLLIKKFIYLTMERERDVQ